MTDKELKRILLTTGYTAQVDKEAVYVYIKQLKEENESLKKVKQYCPYDKKCGELYDCTKEEYETMKQSNVKLSLKYQQLKAENYRLEHNEKVLLQREETAINYIDQVIMYKTCAREIDEELNTLIGILRGDNND